MRPILVEELFTNSQIEKKININGTDVKLYVAEKPHIFNKQFIKFSDRLKMMLDILKGRSIGVFYYDDLNKKEKVKYVKRKINK